VHYLVTMGSALDVREFDRLEDACDAIVLQLSVDAPFTIRGVRPDGAQHEVLTATRSTVRHLECAS
jgi:hypothetical protein